MIRSTRQITYTQPPNAQDAANLREIDAIDSVIASWQQQPPPAAEEAASADASARQQAQARRQTLAGALTPAPQIRVTVGALSALQHAHYQAAIKPALAWASSQTGKAAQGDDADGETEELANLAILWARAQAAIISVEERTAHRLDASASAWQPAATNGWDDPGQYLALPAELIYAVNRAVVDCNPGLFNLDAGDQAKKNGGISAT